MRSSERDEVDHAYDPQVAGDKGYRSEMLHRYLKLRWIGVIIPTKANEVPDPAFEQGTRLQVFGQVMHHQKQ